MEIGYGTQKKEALTGSVTTIGAEKLQQLPTSTFQSALQGTTPGLQLATQDGAPGGNVQIRIRGIGSINASSEPLFVVDGIPVNSDAGSLTQSENANGGRSVNVLATLNPNDIESLTVLKDASATAIYGARGANGVILITTKRGKDGAPKFDFRSQISFNSVASDRRLKPVNREQYIQWFKESWMNRGETEAQADARLAGTFPGLATGVNTNWQDEITQTGLTQSYDLSLAGGSDKINYFASGSAFNQDGFNIGTYFDRYSTRLNLDFKPSEKISFSNNVSLSMSKQRSIPDGTAFQSPNNNSLFLPPLVPVKDDVGNYYSDHRLSANGAILSGNNPVGHLLGDDDRWLKQLRVIDNFSLTYSILKDLKFKSAWGIDIIKIDEYIYDNPNYGDGLASLGRVEEANTTNTNWIGTQTLNYGKTIGQRHNIDGILGFEAQQSDARFVRAIGTNMASTSLRTLATSAVPTTAFSNGTGYSFMSYFGRANYDFDGKYYASLSVRRDGSSRFGSANRWGTFWSIGGGWNIDKESFMKGLDMINSLKLRASFGVTGNADIDNFASLGLYTYALKYNGLPASAPSQIENLNLTWESQENLNLGIDFRLFDRVSGSVDYFSRVSSDLLQNYPISFTTGFDGYTRNVGDMRNSGVEASINVNVVKKESLTVDLGANVTFLKNRMTDLETPFVDGTKRREQGRDFQEYWLYGYAGVDPANGTALWYTNETKEATTSQIANAVRYYDGKSATPDFFGGFNTDIKYKGFSLQALVNYQFGNWIYDFNGRFIHGDASLLPRSTTTWAFDRRWTTPGQESRNPAPIAGNPTGSNSPDQDRHLFDGSYIRLRNVTLAYSVPTQMISRLKLRSVSVYVRASNFWTWTRDQSLYLDPEQSVTGTSSGISPVIKSLSFGLDLGF